MQAGNSYIGKIDDSSDGTNILYESCLQCW